MGLRVSKLHHTFTIIHREDYNISSCGPPYQAWHFSTLGPSFMAPHVAKIFVCDIVRLHGILSNIISDQDPIFISNFWRELFKIQGTV